MELQVNGLLVPLDFLSLVAKLMLHGQSSSESLFQRGNGGNTMLMKPLPEVLVWSHSSLFLLNALLKYAIGIKQYFYNIIHKLRSVFISL